MSLISVKQSLNKLKQCYSKWNQVGIEVWFMEGEERSRQEDSAI